MPQSNLVAIEQLERKFANLKLIFTGRMSSNNLAATFGPEPIELTIYVIDIRSRELKSLTQKVDRVSPNRIYW
jgi:Ni2+-binding GTPase involved in maturation of urease and hydrogenase